MAAAPAAARVSTPAAPMNPRRVVAPDHPVGSSPRRGAGIGSTGGRAGIGSDTGPGADERAASERSRRIVSAPATTATTAVAHASTAPTRGSAVWASAPNAPNAPRPANAIQPRRRASTPITAPSARAMMTVPMTNAGLSFVPNVSTANSLRLAANRSTKRPSTASSGDGATPITAEASWPTASATAAPTMPLTAAAGLEAHRSSWTITTRTFPHRSAGERTGPRPVRGTGTRRGADPWARPSLVRSAPALAGVIITGCGSPRSPGR